MRRFCPNCGQPVSIEASFCRSCGSTLADQPEVQSETDAVDDAERIPERDLGQLVSETFTLYRNHLWPFVIIAMAPQLVSMVASFTPLALSMALTVVALVVSILANGASIHAVAQAMSTSKVDVELCFKQAILKSANLIVGLIIVMAALVGAAILIIIVVGIPLLFYLLVIWIFLAQAVMLEGDTPISALGRSRFLVRGNWWRVFGIGIVYALIAIGIAIPIGIVVGILTLFSSPAALLIGPVLFAFIFPVPYIGLTLLYMDIRVRNEGYTLRTLADQLRRASAEARRI